MNNRTTELREDDRSHNPSGHTNARSEEVRRYHSLIMNLPEPGKEWTAQELREDPNHSDEAADMLRRLTAKNIIEKVGREYQTERHKRVNVYETDGKAYDRAHEYSETIATLPCCPAGTGFINAGSDGDEPPYECRACGERHDRETVIESGVLS